MKRAVLIMGAVSAAAFGFAWNEANNENNCAAVNGAFSQSGGVNYCTWTITETQYGGTNGFTSTWRSVFQRTVAKGSGAGQFLGDTLVSRETVSCVNKQGKDVQLDHPHCTY